MRSPSYRPGRDGGLDITFHLTEAEAEALHVDAPMLADWMDTALWALAMLRIDSNPRQDSAAITPKTLHTVINDLEHRLAPRLQGLRDAAIRHHQAVGGSLNDLTLAMDVPKSTAQSRRKAILRGADRPSHWENWATGRRGQGQQEAPADPAPEDDQTSTTTD